MIDLKDELAEGHPAGCRDYLAAMETDLLAIGKSETRFDEERISRILLAAHSIRHGADFFDLVKLGQLAQHIEDALARVRASRMALIPSGVDVLERAIDRLNELIPNPGTSNQADIADLARALGMLPAEDGTSGDQRGAAAAGQVHAGGGPLRVLLAEDDFSSRLLLQTFLARYGECHVAVNGREAVEAFRTALERKRRYDLVCMDIMMPEMDGAEAVRQIRAMEEADGILSNYGAKIVMTTAVDDIKSVAKCFQDLCDGYLVKPIDLAKLLSLMKSYQLVQ
jgi:two-component system chemotaxis response regulator CheY